MSKKKVLLRGVFINRDTNGEGVLKVGTTLIRVSTVMGILYTAVTEAFESDEMLPIVMELKEEFREIIILYYYEEFSVGEISRMLKIPIGTVKSRLARGRDKLSTIL